MLVIGLRTWSSWRVASPESTTRSCRTNARSEKCREWATKLQPRGPHPFDTWAGLAPEITVSLMIKMRTGSQDTPKAGSMKGMTQLSEKRSLLYMSQCAQIQSQWLTRAGLANWCPSRTPILTTQGGSLAQIYPWSSLVMNSSTTPII